MKELPTAEEINPPDPSVAEPFESQNDLSVDHLQQSVFLPHNRIDSPWDSRTQYVGTHYQLIREDGVAPLRDAVGVFKRNPDMYDSQDVCIYTDVSF